MPALEKSRQPKTLISRHNISLCTVLRIWAWGIISFGRQAGMTSLLAKLMGDETNHAKQLTIAKISVAARFLSLRAISCSVLAKCSLMDRIHCSNPPRRSGCFRASKTLSPTYIPPGPSEQRIPTVRVIDAGLGQAALHEPNISAIIIASLINKWLLYLSWFSLVSF